MDESSSNVTISAQAQAQSATGKPPSQSDSRDNDQRKAKHGLTVRKRTKTGCLTCRKRRIKCGEEHPFCRNCIKSKRNCDGYTQRLTFRDASTWPTDAASVEPTLMYHTASIPGSTTHGEKQQHPPHQDLEPAILTQQTQYTSVQNVPTSNTGWIYGADGRVLGLMAPFTPTTPFVPPGAGPSITTTSQGVPFSVQPDQQSTPSTQMISGNYFVMDPNYMPPSYHYEQHFAWPEPPRQVTHGGPSTPANQHVHYRPSLEHAPLSHLEPPMESQNHWQHPPAGMAHRPLVQGQQSPRLHSEEMHQAWLQHIKPEHDESQPSGNDHHGAIDGSAEVAFHHGGITYTSVYPETTVTIKPEPNLEPVSPAFRTNDFLMAAAVEKQDDEYYDVDSEDDEMLPSAAQAAQHDLGVISRLHQQSISDLVMRHYDAFIFEGVLDQYRADYQASPLKNKLTARVFTHFISAVGPSLGIFERNPRNSSAMFAETALPVAQQSLWTHSIPMMALNNQGLLQTILALSSLHIANLQDASRTPSLKHYMYALKRVHKAVVNPKTRHHITTVAATLLLGYYEVMTADHDKWCSHLSGARQLLQDLDFPGMMDKAISLDREENAISGADHVDLNAPAYDFQSAIDERLISTTIGRQVRFEEPRRAFIEPHLQSRAEMIANSLPGRHTNHGHVPAHFDLQNFKLYQDLWWWFARQDAYQSIVSGNRLLMDYSRWSDCLPRARIGRDDAAYGTHDHIILLLARIADFSAKDRKRKLAVVKARGAPWKPPNGGEFQGLGRIGPPPAGQRPPPPGASQQPSFMGMAPTSNKAYMPSSYGYGTVQDAWARSPQSDTSIPASADVDSKIERDLAATMQDWIAIRSALEVLGSHLGPRYQPIDPSISGIGSIMSPFGPLTCFQKFDVAVLNALYHMLRVILYRAHPEMPPAAMSAAGVAAPFTREAVNKIGQIAAGVFATAALNPVRGVEQRQKPLNPSIGGMLCELSMPLFFAGVQFQAQAQRDWLVDHLHEIEVRAGFATAGMIGHGCETAWKRTGESGMGPPYQRSGYWHKRDIVVDQDPSSPPPAWAQGVRGFEAESMPKVGLEVNTGLELSG